MTSPTQTLLRYKLQACRNLERTMLEMGWRSDADYFRARIRAITRQLAKLSTT